MMKKKEGKTKMPSRLRRLFARPQPQVNIKRDFYTINSMGENEIEIVMYGVIVEERPTDWWTGEVIEGEYIVLSEFLKDLDRLSKAEKITIRMNSVGGDVYATIPIHNRLRELKAHITCIVDGVAMSGGSLIMSAADVVKVYESSMIMIHKCWATVVGNFTTDELQSKISQMEAADKAQVAIYKRKTGLDDDDILSMMAEETYMTGSEAIEKGFADELMEGEGPDIAASADLSTLFVNGKTLRLDNPLVNLPDTIPTVKSDDSSVKTNKVTSGDEEGIIMAKNLEELKAENPDLAAKVIKEARETIAAEMETAAEDERKRIAEIDEIAALYPEELVKEAKYGDNPCSAQELAFRAAKEAAQKGKTFVKELDEDYEASNADDVAATPAVEDDPKPLSKEELMERGRAHARKMQQKEEE